MQWQGGTGEPQSHLLHSPHPACPASEPLCTLFHQAHPHPVLVPRRSNHGDALKLPRSWPLSPIRCTPSSH